MQGDAQHSARTGRGGSGSALGEYSILFADPGEYMAGERRRYGERARRLSRGCTVGGWLPGGARRGAKSLEVRHRQKKMASGMCPDCSPVTLTLTHAGPT